jgi:hypothetical protein
MRFNHTHAGWKRNANLRIDCLGCGEEFTRNAPRQVRCIPCQCDHVIARRKERYQRDKNISDTLTPSNQQSII